MQVIFSKDPNYIVNSNAWPEAVVAKQKAEQENQLRNRQTSLQDHQDKVNIPPPPAAQGRMTIINFSKQTTETPEQGVEDKKEGSKETEGTEVQLLDKKERRGFLVQEMRRRIDKYFEISVKQIADMVPKIITNFLINELLVN